MNERGTPTPNTMANLVLLVRPVINEKCTNVRQQNISAPIIKKKITFEFFVRDENIHELDQVRIQQKF